MLPLTANYRDQRRDPLAKRSSSRPSGKAVYIALVLSLALNSILFIHESSTPPSISRRASARKSPHSLSIASANFSNSSLNESSVPIHRDPDEEEEGKLGLGAPDDDCGGGSLQDLHKHLRNVVVVFSVKEDAAARSMALFLRALYGRFFKEVVVLGPQAHAKEGVDGRSRHLWGNTSGTGMDESLRLSNNGNIGPWCFTTGSYSYFSFPKVVGMYPDAEGYLWLEDQVVLNYWQLIRGNKSKLWLTDMPECQRCQAIVPFDQNRPARAYDAWSDHWIMRKKAAGAFFQLFDKHKKQFLLSMTPHANETSYVKRMVDAFYVPRRFSLELAFDIIPSFRHFGVAPEVALPTMFYALDYPENFDYILHRSEHRMEPSDYKYDASAHWNPYATTFFHWDLSSYEERRKLIQMFSTADMCLQHSNLTLGV